MNTPSVALSLKKTLFQVRIKLKTTAVFFIVKRTDGIIKWNFAIKIPCIPINLLYEYGMLS